MVRLQLIWLGVAAGFLAPAGRQPLLQRRVLMLAAKKVKEPKKGKEAFVPYEISGDSVPMFPLPDRRDAVQARSGRAALPPTRLPCAWWPALRRLLRHCRRHRSLSAARLSAARLLLTSRSRALPHRALLPRPATASSSTAQCIRYFVRPLQSNLLS